MKGLNHPYSVPMHTARSPGLAGRLFLWFADRLLDGHFQQLILEEGQVPPGPLLVLANHSGWWDPFLVHALNRRRWGRRFHVMMLETELSQRKFFRRVGAFSWNRGDRTDAIRGVAYAAGLLTDPANLVLIFPQGEIRSQHQPTQGFGSAPRWILAQAGVVVNTIFVSLLWDYGSRARPTATVRWTVDKPEIGAGTLGDRFNAFLTAARDRHVAP